MNMEPTAATEAALDIASIKEIMDGFEPESLLPELAEVFGHITKICRISVMIAPALMLILGLVYLFLPPREANHMIGYRTWFGMGSVEAWRFTQRIAGLAFTGLGLILGIVMAIISAGFGALEADALVWKTLRCLLWEAGLSLVVVLGLNITTMVFFDSKGEFRRKPNKVR